MIGRNADFRSQISHRSSDVGLRTPVELCLRMDLRIRATLYIRPSLHAEIRLQSWFPQNLFQNILLVTFCPHACEVILFTLVFLLTLRWEVARMHLGLSPVPNLHAVWYSSCKFL